MKSIVETLSVEITPSTDLLASKYTENLAKSVLRTKKAMLDNLFNNIYDARIKRLVMLGEHGNKIVHSQQGLRESNSEHEEKTIGDSRRYGLNGFHSILKEIAQR
jgi:hypothetical protein